MCDIDFVENFCGIIKAMFFGRKIFENNDKSEKIEILFDAIVVHVIRNCASLVCRSHSS